MSHSNNTVNTTALSCNQVEQCKKRMNTFGFVGDLSKEPEVSCVYHSEEAENQYLLNPDKALQLGEGPPGGAAAGGGGAK